MTIQHRSAFFVSDRTAITAEMLGHSLLTQFDDLNLHENTLPFIDSLEKAQEAVQQINAAAVADGVRPIIISTLANTEIAAAVEFVFDGLHLNKRLNKDRTAGKVQYRG